MVRSLSVRGYGGGTEGDGRARCRASVVRRGSHAVLAATLVLVALAVASTRSASGTPSIVAAPSPPLGVGQPAPEPALQYTITCDDGEHFQGALNGSGVLQYPGVPAGTTCTATPVASGALSDVAVKQFAPVPPAGVSIVRYTEAVPAVVLSPPNGPPGRATDVIGAGFPPGATVTLAWSAGQGGPVAAQADGAGRFEVPMLVLSRDQIGLRQLAVTGNGFPAVSVSYLVVPVTVNARGSTAQVAFRT